MKTINLCNVVDFAGKDLKLADGEVLTFKQALVNQCGSHRATDGAQAIKVFTLGQKIYAATGSINLEDAEIDLLKSVLNANALYSALVMGQIFNELDKKAVEA